MAFLTIPPRLGALGLAAAGLVACSDGCVPTGGDVTGDGAGGGVAAGATVTGGAGGGDC